MTTTLPIKDRFDLPEGVIYLDGNSLGAKPKGLLERATRVMQEQWAIELIRAWNTADWMALPQQVGNRIAPLIGAPVDSVTCGDTLSIKIYQALSAALKMRPDRKIILSDSGNFPSDLYMAEGLIATLEQGHRLITPEPEDLIAHINDDVAAVMLTHTDYRSARLHDLHAVTRAAHDAGAVMIWDFAHSVGAMPLDIQASGAEFAVGCTYKYLNGGPGAPAFIYARPDIVKDLHVGLAGWLGHEAPFAMETSYRPAPNTERLRIGTPGIVQLALLDEALSVWEKVDMADVRKASIALSERFIAGVEARCPQLQLASPRDPALRGSHVSFAYEHGYAAMQALIAQGVIGDFRPPMLMRFGFTPLYLDEDDIDRAIDALDGVMRDELWRNPEFQTRSRVT